MTEKRTGQTTGLYLTLIYVEAKQRQIHRSGLSSGITSFYGAKYMQDKTKFIIQ